MAIECTAGSLVELSACFAGLSPKQQQAISTYLLCQIANGGGGGGAAIWGGITGTLSNQTDLQTALNAKLNLSGGQLTGNLTFSADNALDIGASGATRPRRGYFGTEVVSPLFTGSLTGASSLNVLKAGDTMTGLLTIAQATANTTALAVTGYSLTGANAQSMLSLAGTWNTSGTPTAIDLNITDTASNAASLLYNFRVGGTTMSSLSKSGTLYAPLTSFANMTAVNAIIVSNLFIGSGLDAVIVRDAAEIIAHRRGTIAQALRWYRTFTDASNYERGALQTAAGQVIVAAETAGTGTDDIDLTLTPAGAGNVRFGTHSAVGIEIVTGFITIKDAAGNSRKIAVIS